jgi:hypothetical protein
VDEPIEVARRVGRTVETTRVYLLASAGFESSTRVVCGAGLFRCCVQLVNFGKVPEGTTYLAG